MTETFIDAFVARLRALGDFDIVTAADEVEIKERGAVIARVSPGSATVDFPFPPASLSVTTVARILEDYPGIRKSSDGFALTIDDDESLDTAMRYFARRSRIERYAWQAQSDGRSRAVARRTWPRPEAA